MSKVRLSVPGCFCLHLALSPELRFLSNTLSSVLSWAQDPYCSWAEMLANRPSVSGLLKGLLQRMAFSLILKLKPVFVNRVASGVMAGQFLFVRLWQGQGPIPPPARATSLCQLYSATSCSWQPITRSLRPLSSTMTSLRPGLPQSVHVTSDMRFLS